MTRWLPYPLLALWLLAMWLLLNGTLDPGQVLLGAAFALGGGLALVRLQRPYGGVRRAGMIAMLFWLVLADIVRSNLAVARIVLHPRTRPISGFLALPLELRHPGGLAIVACIITATPGSSWAGYDSARGVLTVHVLDLVDEETWRHTFKERYERRLLEIFR